MTALRVDGWFLSLAGLAQLAFELLSHFAAAGPLADRFHQSPFTIGFVEAHGLAAVIGLLLLRSASVPDRRLWHLVACVVHLLLGTANVVFWDSFRTFDLIVPGVVATGFHAAFVLVQGVLATRGANVRAHPVQAFASQGSTRSAAPSGRQVLPWSYADSSTQHHPVTPPAALEE